jgi:peptidoglycan/xylan/chitin deacetylase (PgdA/CDA1 family)
LSILNQLDSIKTKATFHIVSKYLNQVETLTIAQEALKRGHLVGLRFPTLIDPNSLGDDQLYGILQDESTAFYNSLSVYPKFLRLAVGQEKDPRIVGIAQSMGFVVTSYTVDTFDYTKDINSTKILKPYQDQIRLVPYGTVRLIGLHHDLYPVYNQDQTIFEQLRNITRAVGGELVRLDNCTQSEKAYRENNDLPSGTVRSTSQSDAFRMEGTTLLLLLTTLAFIVSLVE